MVWKQKANRPLNFFLIHLTKINVNSEPKPMGGWGGAPPKDHLLEILFPRQILSDLIEYVISEDFEEKWCTKAWIY